MPIAILLTLDATAAAEPPLEPPAINSGNFGFLTNPKCGFLLVTPYANSCKLAVPIIIAPAFFKFIWFTHPY